MSSVLTSTTDIPLNVTSQPDIFDRVMILISIGSVMSILIGVSVCVCFVKIFCKNFKPRECLSECSNMCRGLFDGLCKCCHRTCSCICNARRTGARENESDTWPRTTGRSSNLVTAPAACNDLDIEPPSYASLTRVRAHSSGHRLMMPVSYSDSPPKYDEVVS